MPAMPAAAPTLTATTAARSVSRADIVQLGQTGSPWAFIPVGLQALRARPDDHELRFLLAAAFAKLMLVTPARDQLALLPGSLQNDAGVKALAGAIAQLPSDQIPLTALVATCRANVRALADRDIGPIDLSSQLPEWERRAAAWQWLRARDGNIVRRQAIGGGLNDHWIGLQNIKGQVDGLTLPHAAKGAGGNTPPYILEGIDPPWLVARVLRETPVGADGYDARVTIVHEDPMELLDGLAQVDLSDGLARPRVRVVVGPNAGAMLAARLLIALDTQLMGPGLSMSTVRTPIVPTVEAALQGALTKQSEEQQRLLALVATIYGGRDAAWWKARFAGAARTAEVDARRATAGGLSPPPTPLPLGGGTKAPLNTDGPLRVLVPTCRYSTYIKHSAADLAEAFRRLGCESRVLIEPDDHSHLSGVGYLRTIAEFQPDLVVMINYARANINGLPPEKAGVAAQPPPPVIHLNIPYVMWVQDAMPHQLNARVGATMGPLDFVAGNLREEYFQTFGYPRLRGLDAPIVASSRKFHDGEVSREMRERHTCEMAYVSHHSETPDAMHDRKRREAAANPMLVALIDRLRPGIEPIASGPVGEPISIQLCRLVTETLKATGGDHENEAMLSQLLHIYAMPMADRILRHQTLDWASSICNQRGWRLHLYGRGWEKHPTLAQHARGELTHGDDLRASYHCAAVHLQVSAHTVIHQRVVECALSGGLPIARAHADDLSSLDHWAALAAARQRRGTTSECDACDPWTLIRGRYRNFGYSTSEYAETRQTAALRHRLGLNEPGMFWVNSVHVERMNAASPDARPLTDQRSLFWLLGDPAEYLFADAASLERLIDQAITNPAWRAERVAALRNRALGHMTDEAFARDLIGFVSNRL